MSNLLLLFMCTFAFHIDNVHNIFIPRGMSYQNAKIKGMHSAGQNIYNEFLDKSVQQMLDSNIDHDEIVPNTLNNVFLSFLKLLYPDLHIKNLNSTDLFRLECIGCKSFLSFLKLVSITSDKIASKIAYVVCRLIPLLDEDFCAGLIPIFEPIMRTVLLQSPLTTSEMCGALLGSKCHPINNPKFNWTIPLPPVPKPPVKPINLYKPGGATLRVLHISDSHFDPSYVEGSLADCTLPLCCRGEKINPSNKAAGKWGDYRNCDVPLRTFENALQDINSTHKFDYIIWTGDIPPHDIWKTADEREIDLLNISVNLLKKYFPDVPIFPSLGNHESNPVNIFAVPHLKGNWSNQWLYDAAFEAWTEWLPNITESTIKKAGFYSVEVNPGFRIISLNMNFCDSLNFFLFVNDYDPFDQLKWLVEELFTAETKGEKVHIIGHIPPGLKICMEAWSQNYYKIIDRFESTVAAQFFGHTHYDEFEVFYDVETLKRPTNIAYIGPSITTYEYVNPGYRIYTVDGNYENSSRMVLDHDTYYLNITEANLTDKPVWVHEYSAKSGLNMTSLLPSEWDKLIQTFETNDEQFQKFYRYYYKYSDYKSKPCDSNCKTKILCRLRSGRCDY